MVWKMTKSAKNTNRGIWEGYFIRWVNGVDEIEIIRYYDDDKDKVGGFEVWHQIANKLKNPDSWDGDHLATFKTEKEAVVFAKRYIRNRWLVVV